MMKFVVLGVTTTGFSFLFYHTIPNTITTGVFIETPSLGGLRTKVEESPLPMRQTSPRRKPTRYFKVSGRANRYYTLLKGDLEVAFTKDNLTIPRRNFTTGCCLSHAQDKLLLLLLSPLFYYYYYYHYLKMSVDFGFLQLSCRQLSRYLWHQGVLFACNTNIQFSVQCTIILIRSCFILIVLCKECVPYL